MSSFFLLKWVVQILCLFSQNQTPRSDSVNLEPSEPIFYPQILEPRFTSWVGRSPGLPEWALGYWHCKNRYASQKDLLAAAHGFANRSIPVDIIIVDWLHWKVQGDWYGSCHSATATWQDPGI